MATGQFKMCPICKNNEITLNLELCLICSFKRKYQASPSYYKDNITN